METQLISENNLIDPNIGDVYPNVFRSKDTSKNLLVESKAVDWNNKIKACIDPIMHKDYGCFSDYNDRKFSCLTEVLPSVLECLYFENAAGSYPVVDTSKYTFPCNGETRSRREVRKLYGCASTYGTVVTCDTSQTDFCACPEGKIWDNKNDACSCPPDTTDHGKCCTPETFSCCLVEFSTFDS